MKKASAKHILVESEKTCNELKARIEAGEDFGKIAQEYSKCPSGNQGGDLGEFLPGQMVPEFDEVVFTAEVGKVHGPVKTDFGYHLIEITNRTD
ncbi:peptidylprolyl isomerase [Candidatus Omnitrophota bacterium]